MTAIDALRAAAEGNSFDEERARSNIEAAIDRNRVAALHSVFHKDQARAREVIKALEPILGHLRQLGERLDVMSDERWRDWVWIAADAYCELPDVQDDLDRWNAERAEEFAGTDADLCDYAVSEVDQVARDLGELRKIVAKVELRLRAVADAMKAVDSKGGRPPLVARKALFRDLRIIYEQHTGQKATATKDDNEIGARGPFVNFVVAVNRELRPSLFEAGLGTGIRNFLYPPRTKRRRRV